MSEWRTVPRTNGSYEVSDEGEVRSMRRQGTAGGTLKPYWDDAYAVVNLHIDREQRHHFVHRLVLEAFVGPGDGMDGRHLDGNPGNNSLSNLAWGTRSDNVNDSVRHGTHPNLGHNKQVCKHGHGFMSDNTIVRPDGRWECRACNRRRAREYRERKRALTDPDYFAAKYVAADPTPTLTIATIALGHWQGWW